MAKPHVPFKKDKWKNRSFDKKNVIRPVKVKETKKMLKEKGTR